VGCSRLSILESVPSTFFYPLSFYGGLFTDQTDRHDSCILSHINTRHTPYVLHHTRYPFLERCNYEPAFRRSVLWLWDRMGLEGAVFTHKNPKKKGWKGGWRCLFWLALSFSRKKVRNRAGQVEYSCSGDWLSMASRLTYLFLFLFLFVGVFFCCMLHLTGW